MRAALLFFVAAFLAYGIALTGGFVDWDDPALISQNPVVREISPLTIKTAFTTFDPELYDPLTIVSYQLDWFFGGGSPVMFHFTSIVLHALNGLLLMAVLRKLHIGKTAALLGGLLFVLRPIQAEAVAWASGRKDLLAAFFFLASLLFWLSFREGGRTASYGWSLGAFFCALISKVTALTLPIVLLGITLLFPHGDRTRMLRHLIPYAVLSAVFGLVGIFGKQAVAGALPFSVLGIVSLRSVLLTIQHVMFVGRLAPIYPFTDVPALTVAGAFMTAALVGLFFYYRRSRPLIALAIGIFLVTLVPSFLTAFKGGRVHITADGYAYLPMIGVALLLAYLADGELRVDRRWMTRIGGALLALFVVLAHMQASVWRSSEQLFTYALAAEPQAVEAQNNLAFLLMRDGKWEEARVAIDATLAIAPYARAYVNGGNLLKHEQKFPEAKAAYEQAIATDPRDPEPVYALALLLAERGDNAGALQQFRTVVSISPTHGVSWRSIAEILLIQGDAAGALDPALRAVNVDPFSAQNYATLASVRERNGDVQGAVEALHMAAIRAVHQPGALQDILNVARRIFENHPENVDIQNVLRWMMDAGLVQRRS